MELTGLVDKVLEENAGADNETPLQRRDVELWPLAEGLVREMHPVAQAGRTVLVNQVPESLLVNADGALLRRILQNLLGNAIRHAGAAEVVIRARRVAEEAQVECEVVDNGCGIPEERLPHIFEKFETDRRGEGGLGLGLAICRSFVLAHGGEISAHARDGGGTVMRFSLPDARA